MYNAIKDRQIEIAKLLIKAKIPIDPGSMFQAVKNEDIELVKLLLEAEGPIYRILKAKGPILNANS